MEPSKVRETPVILILLTLVLGAVVGLATGGSPASFPSIRLRGWWLAVIGVVLQLVNPGGWTGHAAVVASFAFLLAFASVNIRSAGFVLICAGLALNAFVIVLNGGMPVTREAIVRSGQSSTLPELVAGDGGAKHHLADADSVLLLLGDAIALPRPIGQVMSVGDLLLDTGIAWYVAAAMHDTRRRPAVAGAGVPQVTSR
jgi:Family of unknown function (DUF5317)